MTKLIVNADDFGYTDAVNMGIISAYKNGYFYRKITKL
ncbi:MAG: ChbG/HpnK family deacetylase [Romboutsia sp.]